MGINIKRQESIYLGTKATVFQAEITAITEACRNLLKSEITAHDINIHVDSQSAIRAVSNYEIKNRNVLECKHMLNSISQRKRVTLIKWIPGHKGHMGNKVADQLSKKQKEEWKWKERDQNPSYQSANN